jgi:ATP-binding cassette subfamily B protein
MARTATLIPVGADMRRLLSHARPYRWSLLSVSGLMVVEAAAMLSLPWLGGALLGNFLSGDVATAQPWIIAALLALLAVQAVLRYVSVTVSGQVAERMLADLRARTFEHLLRLPLSFHQRSRQGELLALATYDIAHMSSFLSGTLVGLAPTLLMASGAIAAMFWLDPRLALAITVLVPVFYLATKLIGRQLRPLAVETQEAHARALALAEQGLHMLPTLKSFAREDEACRRHREQLDRVARLEILQLRVRAALGPTVRLLAGVSAVFVVVLLGARVRDGASSMAETASFLMYAALLTAPVGALADVYGRAQAALGTLARLQRALDERPEAVEDAGKPPLPAVRGEIAFDELCYARPERGWRLERVCLRIPAGRTIAIVGENGVGKSTLVELLLRLHDATAGGITIDGIDITRVDRESVRRQVGYVAQHTLLFNGTVAENIVFGRTSVGKAEIEEASRLARAHDFIVELPAGYETEIGDHGTRLSGGQRQRIALARALVGRPPILVLDEATAMLDPAVEAEFLAGAAQSFVGRTVIMITHRSAGLAIADRVVRLHAGGRIEELPFQSRRRPMPGMIDLDRAGNDMVTFE